MARVIAVCTSDKKGIGKTPVGEITLEPAHGVRGDAHAGDWHRQVSLLAEESHDRMNARGGRVVPGDFGENVVTRGIDLVALPVGTELVLGAARVRVTQIGKECHTRCAIFHRVGDCVMPKEGIFVEVLTGGALRPGDTIAVVDAGG